MVKNVARVIIGACFGGIAGWCLNPKSIAIPIIMAAVGLVVFCVYQFCE